MESEEWGWTKGSMKVFSSSSTKVERLENDRIAKRVYVGECAGNHSVSRQQKSWIYTMKDYLRKRGLGVRQARRIVIFNKYLFIYFLNITPSHHYGVGTHHAMK